MTPDLRPTAGMKAMGDEGGTPHSFSSQVHPSETNSPSSDPYISHPQFGRPEFSCQPASRQEQAFRHSGWALRRNQVYASLRRLHKRDARLDRFCNCGSGLWLQRSEDGQDIRLSSNKCHDRCCVPCQAERAGYICENLARLLDTEKTRFLTLTLRHSRTPLKDQIDRLYRSFAALRRRQAFRSHIDGGAAFLETKLAESDGLWHPHLHVLVTGTYWDCREISREWHAVTGDSSIVKMKAVTDSGTIAHYVTKYVTKPLDPSVYAQADTLDEAINALGGRRLCFTFGSWRGVKLEARPDDEREWVAVGSIDQLRADWQRGDADAQRFLEAAARKWPLFASIFLKPPNASG